MPLWVLASQGVLREPLIAKLSDLVSHSFLNFAAFEIEEHFLHLKHLPTVLSEILGCLAFPSVTLMTFVISLLPLTPVLSWVSHFFSPPYFTLNCAHYL